MRISALRVLIVAGFAAITVGLVSGCAGQSVAGTPGTVSTGTGTVPTVNTTGTTTVDPPECAASTSSVGDPSTPTGQPVITVTRGSNYWISNSRTEPLAVAVYADGTAIRSEEYGAYGDPLPELTIGRIDPCVLDEAVAEFDKLGAADFGDALITDQGTTTVVVRSGESEQSISVYALGIGDEYVEPAQEAARQKLGATISGLIEGMSDTAAWTPDRLRITSLGEPLGDLSDRPAPLTWPLAAGIAATLDQGVVGAECGVVENHEAQRMLETLGANPAATLWTDGEQQIVLAIGVLMPGQFGCPQG
jgi:hypothetical protein